MQEISEKDFPKLNHSKKFYYLKFYDVMYKNVCSSEEKFALLDSRDNYEAYLPSLECSLMQIPQSFFPSQWTAGITPNYKYKKSFDIG